jgi:hypothetical protein
MEAADTERAKRLGQEAKMAALASVEKRKKAHERITSE